MLEKLFEKQIAKAVKDRVEVKERELENLKKELEDEKFKIKKQSERTNERYQKARNIERDNKNLIKDIEKKLKELELKENKLNEFEQEINIPLYLSECGNYQVEELFYRYEDSNNYKQAIQEINDKMSEMVKDKKACVCQTQWYVNGSKREGDKQINGTIKLALRLFNAESNNYISLINIRSNISNVVKKIQKTANDVNKFCRTQEVALQQGYVDLKIELANLVYEQSMKKQEEKEEARRQAEIIREQEKLEREIAKEREKLAKEIKQYQTEIDRLYATVDMETGEIASEVAERLGELESKIEDITNQDVTLEKRVHNKAGWVYVIASPTNRNMVKIGTTRRLDPYDRITELSGASVPFKMLTYGIVFSEDAFTLESKLHKHFNKKRINVINYRREWFNCSPQEVYEVVKENIDNTVEFNFGIKDYEYEESVKVWNM